MPRKKKVIHKYEDYSDVIDQELTKRRRKWTLTSINHFDFFDISQIIRLHIFKKMYQFNPAKGPFSHWCSRIISNQTKNIIRNNYSNFKRPCLSCAAFEGETLCRIYVTQNTACPLYALWEKRKKTAYNVKLPVSINELENGIPEKECKNFDVEKGGKAIHDKMITILKDNELIAYKYLYMDGNDQEGLAIHLGLKTTEKHRKNGYKTISNIVKSIMIKVKKVLYSDQIDII